MILKTIFFYIFFYVLILQIVIKSVILEAFNTYKDVFTWPVLIFLGYN